MLLTNRDYFIKTEPIEEKLKLQAQDFISEDEEIICTFESADVIAFFTNKKIIFVADIKSKFHETDIVPYSSIKRFILVGAPDTKHYGRMDISVSDEIILPFMLENYQDATALCNKILSHI